MTSTRDHLDEIRINFKGCDKTIGEMFRRGPMTFVEMQERLWNFIIDNNLIICRPSYVRKRILETAKRKRGNHES